MLNSNAKPTQTALITGASSGIGKAFALALAQQRRWNLILVARQTGPLEEVKKSIETLWGTGDAPRVAIESVDLLSESNRTALINRLHAQDITIDFLINNAGMGFGISALQFFDKGDSHFQEQMITLNCIAPAHLCRLVLPGMLERKSGAIINVCSRRALAPTPFLACYAASKSFLLNVSVAMATEVREKGVNILAFCPSPTDTPGHRLHDGGKKSLFKPMQAEGVVQIALKALENKHSVCVAGWMNKIVFGLFHLMPLAWAAKLQALITTATYGTAKR